MARDVFSVQELTQLRGFPGISAEELILSFTLSGADEMFVRSMRQPATMLGVAVQLCSLPWLGFVPDEVAAAPVAAVERLSARLGISSGVLAGYRRREQTRTDHLRAVMAYLGWHPPRAGEQQMMMMMHLDVQVEYLTAASAHAVAVGAQLMQHQPEERVLVHLDPAGHPFCLFLPDS